MRVSECMRMLTKYEERIGGVRWRQDCKRVSEEYSATATLCTSDTLRQSDALRRTLSSYSTDTLIHSDTLHRTPLIPSYRLSRVISRRHTDYLELAYGCRPWLKLCRRITFINTFEDSFSAGYNFPVRGNSHRFYFSNGKISKPMSCSTDRAGAKTEVFIFDSTKSKFS